jgi:hypothetical protein
VGHLGFKIGHCLIQLSVSILATQLMWDSRDSEAFNRSVTPPHGILVYLKTGISEGTLL